MFKKSHTSGERSGPNGSIVFLPFFLLVNWLVFFGLTALSDSISAYFEPSLREGERKRNNT